MTLSVILARVWATASRLTADPADHITSPETARATLYDRPLDGIVSPGAQLWTFGSVAIGFQSHL
jgi:hypothetical protein